MSKKQLCGYCNHLMDHHDIGPDNDPNDTVPCSDCPDGTCHFPDIP